MNKLVCATFFLLSSLTLINCQYLNSREKVSKIFDQFNNQGNQREQVSDIYKLFGVKSIFENVSSLFVNLYGRKDEIPRPILNIFVKILDFVRYSFIRRTYRSSEGLIGAIDDVVVSILTLARGYVKSVLSENEICMKRHLCQSTRDATKEAKSMGLVVARFGGYMMSYLLEQQRNSPFKLNYEAAKQGWKGEECEKIFHSCDETD